MTKAEVRSSIEEIGIVPGVRVSSAEHARFAAESLYRADIPIVEITMTVPQALEVITGLARDFPNLIIGAGTVLDGENAARCLDAGAQFLTSPGLVMEVLEFALKKDVVYFPGALTPTEVIAAWKAGADFVKIFPCAQVGGPAYIRALKVPLPQVPLIASGGVNQMTAVNFMMAGATALGIGAELIPPEALPRRHEAHIRELARRYISMVKYARAEKAGKQ